MYDTSRLVVLVVVCAIVLLPVETSAQPTNPDPGSFGDDLGIGLFLGTGDTISVELFDLFGFFGAPSSFGFYFESDPTTRIDIFKTGDQGPPDQTAFISFAAGFVVDLDETESTGSIVVESVFAPSSEPLGFFVDLGGVVLFSEPDLNGGDDAFAVFRFLADPNTLLLGFDFPPDPSIGALTFHLTAGALVPVPEPVPEPTFALAPVKVNVHFHGKDVADGVFDRADVDGSVQLQVGQTRADFITDPEALTVEVQVRVALADQTIAEENLTLAIKGKDGKKWASKRPGGESLPPVKELKLDWKNEEYDSHKADLPNGLPKIKTKIISSDGTDLTLDFKNVPLPSILTVSDPAGGGACGIAVDSDGNVTPSSPDLNCEIESVKTRRDGPKVSLTLSFRLTVDTVITFFASNGDIVRIPVTEGVNFFPETAKLKLKVDKSALSAGLTSDSEPKKVELEITLGSAVGSLVLNEEDFDEITIKDWRKKKDK